MHAHRTHRKTSGTSSRFTFRRRDDCYERKRALFIITAVECNTTSWYYKLNKLHSWLNSDYVVLHVRALRFKAYDIHILNSPFLRTSIKLFSTAFVFLFWRIQSNSCRAVFWRFKFYPVWTAHMIFFYNCDYLVN